MLASSLGPAQKSIDWSPFLVDVNLLVKQIDIETLRPWDGGIQTQFKAKEKKGTRFKVKVYYQRNIEALVYSFTDISDGIEGWDGRGLCWSDDVVRLRIPNPNKFNTRTTTLLRQLYKSINRILQPLNSSRARQMSLSNKLAITDLADKIKGKRILIRYLASVEVDH